MWVPLIQQLQLLVLRIRSLKQRVGGKIPLTNCISIYPACSYRELHRCCPGLGGTDFCLLVVVVFLVSAFLLFYGLSLVLCGYLGEGCALGCLGR